MQNLLWAIIAMVMCLFAACSDDDEDKTPQGPTMTYAGKLPSKVGNYSFVYDDNGRCVQVKSGSYVLGEIDYDKGILISDDEEAKVSFTGKGYIKSIKASWDYKDEDGSYKGSGEISFSYNGDGQLTSYSESSSESGKEDGESFSFKGTYKATYTWKNGNLVKVVTEEMDTEDGEKSEAGSTCTIEYGDQKNELGQYSVGLADVLDMEDADIFAYVGMLGKASSYFPVSYTEEWYEKDSDGYENEGKHDSNMTYSFNSDGTIATEYVNGRSYNYSYITYDEDDSLGRSSVFEDNSDAKSLNFRSFFMRHRGRK